MVWFQKNDQFCELKIQNVIGHYEIYQPNFTSIDFKIRL
jgi:hypothetical protein